MGMRRAQHDGIDLAGQVFVGGVAAGAAHQPQILAAAHRLADAGTHDAGIIGGLIHHVLPPAMLVEASTPRQRVPVPPMIACTDNIGPRM